MNNVMRSSRIAVLKELFFSADSDVLAAELFFDAGYSFGAYATWTDPDTGRTVRGTISAEYDFDNDQPLGYRLIDLDNLE